MMEHTTDRMFWTLTSIIVGALILTLGANTFPKATQNTVQTFSGMTKQADTATSHVSDAANAVLNGSDNTTSNNGTSGNNNTSQQQAINPDASAKANAVEASTLGFTVTNNGDGTGTITGYDDSKGSNVNIPKYVKINGTLVKITSIGDYAFFNNKLTSVNIPSSVTSIGDSAFYNSKLTSVNIPNSVTSISASAFQNNKLTSVNIPNSVTSIGKYAFMSNKLTSVNIPNSVTNIGTYAFISNNLTSVNIPNTQGYQSSNQSAKTNGAFDNSVNVTNNPSSN